ncbi:GM21842 [Drosophila sechellia]|uniref:GM21842 n=1 Tax=Drosophila sechellia TaxID=7238 RepID=B4HNB7_DROSE|nr:GM21842 [Drosophila sechellia]
MANNNHPHPGHLSQAAQNGSWNPLQIPSYIPRQPQLAHMSNERPGMVRSPLAWHVSGSVSAQPPPPPDAIYNFMSANHKNLDHHHQMNPLLAPPYSGTLPFNSMDLSLQSARSAAQPLAKQPPNQQPHQTQQQQQSLIHAPNYPSIQNLTTNATPTSTQLQQQQQQEHLAAMAAAHVSLLQSSRPNQGAPSGNLSNGGDCESLLPPPPPTSVSGNTNHTGSNSSSNTGSNNHITSPHYMQSRDENFKLTQLKRGFDPDLSGKNPQKEKDFGYPSVSSASKLPTHNVQQQHANKKPSPLRNYHQQQQPPYNLTPKYNGPQTPPTPQSPLAANPHQILSPTMDYNQLHLHHQLNSSSGGSYQHMQQDQTQSQSHPQHLHYHNQHATSQTAPPPLLPPLLTSGQFHAQPQDAGQQQTASSSQHQTLHSRNAQLTNLDLAVKHKPESEEQPVITDLSYRNSEADKTAANPVPEAPESPYLTTSNEESLESNSNSSNSRKRRKRKASMVMRVTPNENALEGENSKPQHQQQAAHLNNSCSPKKSPKNGGGEFQPFSSQKQSQTQNEKTTQENGRGVSPAPAENNSNSNSSTLYNDNENPKTKKQRQALLQRNLTEQHRMQQDDESPNKHTSPAMQPPSPQSNSSSSSSSSSSANTHSSQMEQGDIDAKPAVSVHECDEEEEPAVNKESPAHPVPPSTAAVAAPPATESPKKSSPAANSESCPFGEVEDKLEQMFAGIEEETERISSPEKPAEESEAMVAHDLTAQLALDPSKTLDTPAENQTSVLAVLAPNQTPTPEIRPVATKAAMKSTMPSPVHSPTPQSRSTSTPLAAGDDSKSNTPVPAKTHAPRRPPPRRLSMGMDASLLRFMIDDPPAKKQGRKKKVTKDPDFEDDDKPSTSAAAAAALAARQLSESASAIKSKPATGAKKKNAVVKGKKGSVGKGNAKNAKQNGKKSARKPAFTTDEDSTPAPTNGGGSVPELRFKSPFILIKPDGSVSIKNTHSAEDVNEKQTKVKKAPHERKNLRGMHSSTLSNRYDADTTDSTWICVFCKRGPHKLGLGDLFGPYLVTSDCDEYRAAVQTPGAQDIDGLFVNKRRREDMVKGQERNLPAVPATLAYIMQAPKISMHKRKRKQTHDSSISYSDDPNESRSQCSSVDPLDCTTESKFVETFRGMGKTSENGFEVWLHEDCAVWSNDIHLIGAHVNGLDAAVWDSTRYQCVLCQQTGASICCFQRCCKAAAHVPCARSDNWSLSEEDRKVYCQLHRHEPDVVEPMKTESIAPVEAQVAPPQAPAPPPAFNIHSLP